MKYISIIILCGILSISSAFANPSEYLTCHTSGIALAEVSIGVQQIYNDSHPATAFLLVNVTFSSGNSLALRSDPVPLALVQAKELAVILRKSDASEMGGGISNAGVLVVHNDKAVLSVNGFVYRLDCKPALEN